MKIASWNINSVRARQDRLIAYLKTAAPDVLCVQELKCAEDQFPGLEVLSAGYQSAVHGQKTYNGVAILSREPLTDVVRGLQDGVEDPQSRVIAATVRGVRVICVYAPNGQTVGSEAYAYKLDWFGRLRRYLDQRHKKDERLVVCGDFNVAPDDIDVHDPALWEGQVLFSKPERDALKHVAEFGLHDTYRKHHAEGGRYTWWDYRQLSFPKNKGLRIDHLLATEPLLKTSTASEIDRDQRKGAQPSDHAPLWAEYWI